MVYNPTKTVEIGESLHLVYWKDNHPDYPRTQLDKIFSSYDKAKNYIEKEMNGKAINSSEFDQYNVDWRDSEGNKYWITTEVLN